MRRITCTIIHSNLLSATEHEGIERPDGAVHVVDIRSGKPSTFQYAHIHCGTAMSLILPTDSLLFGNAQRQQDPMGDGTATSPRLDIKGKGRAQPSSDILALDLGAAEEGQGSATSDAFMQMQLVEQQVRVTVE